MIKMGRLDKKFSETANTSVRSSKEYERYRKKFNSKGKRKHARFD